jgi:uncharacterized protein involved in exopolysaccharide biosynthesis
MTHPEALEGIEDDGIDLIALLDPAIRRWKTVLAVAVFGGILGYGICQLVTPKFVAVNTFMPPQQQQSAGMSALSSLGALAGVGAGSGSKNTPDQYIALMQSTTISDRIIQKFGLLQLWDDRYRVDARKRLAKQVDITSGKKDGLMHVAVTDTDPKRAAAIANQYVEELRNLTNVIAVTEAQQRRVFFERLLEQTRDKLSSAQSALESSGYTSGALNSEPQNVAEGYARLQAEQTAAEVKLRVLRERLADESPEVRSQRETLNALASQLAKMESRDKAHATSANYVSRYREFKYQETLFELFSRQYENARVDESREGGLIQVVDEATPPERKSSPSGSIFTLVGFALGLAAGAGTLVFRARRAGLVTPA